ncbi:uncharacterized protein RHO25_002153 [Cercospora beticola]|uniref:Heterokaryon incompatibility domain-containing protein n=1 Tax=Cercospora beticola TaxID=122368 RepID=A0ABZ0NDF1_CERBT|nr:hypothetical protein RHO25_002153 [Cercospora beticola]
MPDPGTVFNDFGRVTAEADIADAITTNGLQPSVAAFNEDHIPSIWDTWDREAFRKCTWFTRAWTLQEMIAPRQVRFYSQSWRFICDLEDIVPDISGLTGVHESLWTEQRPLDTFSVAQKMSWASARTSTKIEDRTYSLLGLMGVNIPVVYGEGIKAFQRLQDEILRTGSDDSIFAFKSSRGTYGVATYYTMFLLAQSPEEFRGCGNIVIRNEHVATGYRAGTREVTFHQRIVGRFDGLRWKHRHEITRTLFGWYNVASDYKVKRFMILRCALEDKPEIVLAMRLQSLDFPRSDLYAVDGSGSGLHVEPLRISAHDYDSCPYKTFSVLRDPMPDRSQEYVQSKRNVIILCDSKCTLNIGLKSTSIQGAWNQGRLCFELRADEHYSLPEFDAELELSMPGSESKIRAHVKFWPTDNVSRFLRLRFHQAISLPWWTTLILWTDMYYSTFVPYESGFLVGRAYPWKSPLGKNNLLFLEFEYMELPLLLLHACRRTGLFVASCIAFMLVIAAIGTMGAPTVMWSTFKQKAVIWFLLPMLIWFLTSAVLYHFDKMPLRILLAVPFGILGALSAIIMLYFSMILSPTCCVPLTGSKKAQEEIERFKALMEDPHWSQQNWTRRAMEHIKTFVIEWWFGIKWVISYNL